MNVNGFVLGITSLLFIFSWSSVNLVCSENPFFEFFFSKKDYNEKPARFLAGTPKLLLNFKYKCNTLKIMLSF